MKYSFPILLALIVGLACGYLVKEAVPSSAAPESNPAEICAEFVSRYKKLSEQFVALQQTHQAEKNSLEKNCVVQSPGVSNETKSGSLQGQDKPEKINSTEVSNDDLPDKKEKDFGFRPDVVEQDKEKERNDLPKEPDKVSQLNFDALKKLESKLESQSQKIGNGVNKRSFLNQIVLADPHGSIDRMQEVSEKDKWMAKLLGVYRGGITYLQRDRPPGYIRLEIRRPENPPWQWALRVDVHDKKGSAERKMGGMEMLRTLDDQSKAYFVRASENSYLQFYLQVSEEVLVGNYYERGKGGSYSRTGTYTLKRSED